jgi:hypothetical protein
MPAFTISRQDLYLHCKLSGLERVGRSADICGLTESEKEND